MTDDAAKGIADTLRKRADSCRALAEGHLAAGNIRAADRCLGKAAAYEHSMEIVADELSKAKIKTRKETQ